jgi:outer membrane protein, multidrug efflux system
MNTSIVALIVLIALTIAGCSLAPTYERPAAPIASSYPGVSAGTTPSRGASDIPWREHISDARLVKLIELALTNNRDLKVAALNVERARAQFQIQRADQWPTLNATAQGVSQRSSGALSPTGTGFRLEYFQSALGITAYELDFFGRVRSLGESALAQYLSTDEAAKSVQISLVAAIASNWIALVADHELLTLARLTASSREQTLKATELRYKNGIVSELDVRQVETLFQSARATIAQLQRTRELDRNALSLLIGQALPAEFVSDQLPGASLDSAMLARDVPVGLPSDLLTQRPDIRSAEQLLIANNANIGAARAALFPRFALTTSFGSASSDLSQMLSAPNRTWSIIPGVSLPIFDSGRNQANLEVSKVNRDIAVAQYEKSIQTAFREVADALTSRTALADQVTALRAQQSSETARLKLVDARYKGGVSNSLELLDAQRSLFAVQQQVIQTQLLSWQTEVNLYKALGGGWSQADRLK